MSIHRTIASLIVAGYATVDVDRLIGDDMLLTEVLDVIDEQAEAAKD